MCDMFVNSKLSVRNGKLNSDQKSLTKQQILMYKTVVYALVNGRISHKKAYIRKKVILLSGTLTLRQ